MKDKLRKVCTINYFKPNLLGLTVFPFNTWREHFLCEAIDGPSFDVDFMCFLHYLLKVTLPFLSFKTIELSYY